ncbi:hypothetical protein RhiLY_11532 [Ceratobasidium sp. AG-Ba]|nr:hypothetical protein RhiLY_11532 [Ceratobasidium sp. AG-Ba]
MSDNGNALGRGHRVSVKTPAMLEYQAGRQKSKQMVENNARTKNVQQQESRLVAEERAKTQNSKAAKGKNKAKPTTPSVEPSSAALEIDPEEAHNVAETLKYERRCIKLQFMIHGRTGKPIEELKLMDGDELEAEWEKAMTGAPVQASGPVHPPAKLTSKALSSKASTNKVRDPPVAMATPAKKVRASKTVASKVSLIGSPLVPLAQAWAQSARAEVSSPVVLKRTRDVSTERTDEDSRRRRVVPNDTGVTQTKPLTTRKIVVQPAASGLPSRASSSAPSTNSGHSKSGGFKRAASHSFALDAEMIDLGDLGQDDENEEDEEMEVVERAASNNDQNKKAPLRPKKSDFKGTTEGLVIERAVDYIETALI